MSSIIKISLTNATPTIQKTRSTSKSRLMKRAKKFKFKRNPSTSTAKNMKALLFVTTSLKCKNWMTYLIKTYKMMPLIGQKQRLQKMSKKTRFQTKTWSQ